MKTALNKINDIIGEFDSLRVKICAVGIENPLEKEAYEITMKLCQLHDDISKLSTPPPPSREVFNCPECGEEIQYGFSDGVLERLKQSKLFPPSVSEDRKALEAVWKLRDLITYGGDIEEEHADEARALSDLMKYIESVLQEKGGEWGTNVRGNQSWKSNKKEEQQLSVSEEEITTATDQRPVIECIVMNVLDGMVGIGGIPGNDEFCDEFDMRLRAALDVFHPQEPGIQNKEEK